MQQNFGGGVGCARIYSSEGESFVSRSEGGDDGVWVDTADVTLASGARVVNLAVKAFSNPVASPDDGGGAGGDGDQDQSAGDDQADGVPGEGGGQSEGDQATGGNQVGTGQAGEDAPTQRPTADAGSSASSDGEPLAATPDGSLRPLPLAALGACALACPVVLLVRRRLSSR